MRSFIIVLCGVATTTVLQGCGGATSTPAPTPTPKGQCVNSQIDVKSQSRTSTTKMTATSSILGIAAKEVVDGTSTTKMDVDNMNLYENSVSTMSLTMSGDSPIPLPPIHVKTEEKIIVNVAKKVITVWLKITNVTSGKVLLTNCSAVTIDAMPPPALVSMVLKAGVVKMQEFVTCSQNDGKYDHFDMKINVQAPTIPGLKAVTDVDVKGNETILMDKDLVMHSANGHLKVKATVVTKGAKMPLTLDETTDITASQAAPGGPEPADLDYSSWGTCTPIHIPKGGPGDVTTLFQATKLSEIKKKFFKDQCLFKNQCALQESMRSSRTKLSAHNNALFKNQFLAAIQAAIKTTEAKQLIV